MKDERIAELMGWPAFLTLEQCGAGYIVTRLKNLVATAEREEREKANARIADLERKLACARAEMAEDLIARNREVINRDFPDLLASEEGAKIEAQLQKAEEEIRAVIPAPSGYVCVPVRALEDFRDTILHERGALAESGMTSDQVNDVLGEFDNIFNEFLKAHKESK